MRGFEIEELFICQCGDPSHQFIIYADKETTEGPCAFVSVHLNREHNVFKRIWTAIKYVFGRRCIYGDFDEVIINPNDADRLQKVLDLEDWQVFYVDSTLKHDFPAMKEELEKLRNSKVSNMMLYMAVQDKWWEQIDATYKRIFTAEQWAAYLKSGAAKIQKARAKRQAKASGQ